MAQAFDTDKFIIEVELRKAIWDLSSDEYSNRDLKKKQWEEIVDLFGGEGLPDEEKKFLGETLQKKWKNLRSCFARETRRLKNIKSGSAVSHKSPYIYYKQLLFLKNATANSNTESSIAKEQSTNDEDPLGPYSRENTFGRKKKKTTDDGTKELLETLNKCIATRKNNEDVLERDEDKMFLLSLLSSFRKIPEHKKPAAKIQLITVIDSFNTSTSNNAYPNRMYQNYSGYGYGYFTPASSTAPTQQVRLRPETHNYYTLPTPAEPQKNEQFNQPSTSYERPESRSSIATSGASQDSDILDLF